MNINWKKVLKVAERIIHIVRNSIPSTERDDIHGKHHKGNYSNNRHRNKKEVKDGLH